MSQEVVTQETVETTEKPLQKNAQPKLQRRVITAPEVVTLKKRLKEGKPLRNIDRQRLRLLAEYNHGVKMERKKHLREPQANERALAAALDAVEEEEQKQASENNE